MNGCRLRVQPLARGRRWYFGNLREWIKLVPAERNPRAFWDV